ncbi:KdsC family phosphatase [Pedobacter xixiisoli]|uniref:3-deoxy-D-manno-octulosonate 8-phosphate phosphatase (KDO 8-P phosphatase) n=1 Tax=Pedobacter xixiisoli TaxID=1476464 RepID=A0A285ZZ93_9SPHI|nr:HAD-IIIA family hydrolase [Pedobacter xixiisoli]SOD14964.1 3-deoxy-D-manno-octulosonate 8-phosphate phosphatase (KDO 8-P phosphatase) [Pedobacter xixiisoli]
MLQNLKNITTFIFDVDGVLTNGTVIATESGELLRSFNIKDGYALQLAAKKGYHVCIISGGRGIALSKRFEGLGIADVFLGVDDKVEVFNNYIQRKGISPYQVLYMGDDIPDAEVMKLVGIATCPADAVEEIKAIAHYISPKNGGDAAARDVIEKVLKVQYNWNGDTPSAAEASK